MKIVSYPDPKLLARTKPIEEVTDEIRTKVERMFELMFEDKGVGLAAPQVAWSVRLFIVNTSGEADQPELNRVYINPKIKRRKGRVLGPEGCLSFPGIFVDIERAAVIQVEYQDLDGKQHQETLEDFDARVFQHELDHLDNVLLIHRMSQADKVKTREQVEELKRSYQPIS